MDETNCKELIENSKIVKSFLGGQKEPAQEEQVTIDFAFATVVSIKPILKGEVFTKENIWVKTIRYFMAISLDLLFSF